MKNIILVKYLDDDTKARRIETALAETRVDFQVNLEKQCVIVEGNSDMVAVAPAPGGSAGRSPPDRP